MIGKQPCNRLRVPKDAGTATVARRPRILIDMAMYLQARMSFAYSGHMSGQGTISALRRVRVWLGHALLVAFVLKALIPAGFMPDFSGADGGSFKIVICTANGTKIVDADVDGTPHDGPVAKHMGEPCALGSLAVLTLPDLLATVASPATDAASLAPLQLSVSLPPARAGPANGSRAPPFLA
jgi:hypothetical protein